MAAKPEPEQGSPAPEVPSPDRGREPGGRSGADERYGPLLVVRPGKADGRRLILYGRA